MLTLLQRQLRCCLHAHPGETVDGTPHDLSLFSYVIDFNEDAEVLVGRNFSFAFSGEAND